MHDYIGLHGRASLGAVATTTWVKDPKRLLFTLSRYKAVSKILEGRKNVLEVGCGDGWCSRIVAQTVESLTVTDMDVAFVSEASNCSVGDQCISYQVHDIVNSPLFGEFDALYCLDVLEHIHPNDESRFIGNAINSCKQNALFAFGMPSLQSQEIIPIEKRDPGHINCKTKDQLRAILDQHFDVCIVFSMNDEVLHTGHSDMSHYLLAVCALPKK
jgi:2-polyprenyl-3-methyl-5-hydroxy-6-metoxy-1,4-benzoquinol methylase